MLQSIEDVTRSWPGRELVEGPPAFSGTGLRYDRQISQSTM